MKHVFLVLVLLIPLLSACIRIEPRKSSPDTAAPKASPAPDGKTEVSPGKISPSARAFLQKIERKEICWEDISRYPAPEQMWREERFRQVRPGGKLRPSDFQLTGSVLLPGRRERVSCVFLPLQVAYDGGRVWETRIDFTFGDEGNELGEIRMYSGLTKRSDPGIFRLSASDCNAISGVVLKKLFALRLPEGVRAKERYRFCFPVNGSDEKFRNHLRPRGRIPELDPTEEYPNFPLPFEKGRYRSLEHGAFYYYAGIALPVTEKEVWVFDTSIRYAGGETRGALFKLKKGLIFWEIVTESDCDAPSRAVQEQEKP